MGAEQSLGHLRLLAAAHPDREGPRVCAGVSEHPWKCLDCSSTRVQSDPHRFAIARAAGSRLASWPEDTSRGDRGE